MGISEAEQEFINKLAEKRRIKKARRARREDLIRQGAMPWVRGYRFRR